MKDLEEKIKTHPGKILGMLIAEYGQDRIIEAASVRPFDNPKPDCPQGYVYDNILHKCVPDIG